MADSPYRTLNYEDPYKQVTPPTADSPDFGGQIQAPQTGGVQDPNAPVWGKTQRDAFRDAWMSQAPGTDLTQFIQTNPTAAPWASQFNIQGDKVGLPTRPDDKYGDQGREWLDLITDAGPGGANTAAWTDYGGRGEYGAVQAPFPGVPTGTSPMNTTMNDPRFRNMNAGYNPYGMSLDASASGSNVLDPRFDDLYNTLITRSDQSLTPNAKNPIIAAQTDAYRAEQQRGVRDYLAQQAESQGPNANLGSEGRLANEHAAQATGGLQASLMANELQAQRQEIQAALAQRGAMLSDQQRLALQQKLGMIDANLRQQGINSGNDQFAARLGFDTADRASYWDALRSGVL